MDNMDYNLEITKLQSNAELVKVLAKIALVCSSFTIIVLLFGFNLPDPVIFSAILLIPVAFVAINNYITKFYQMKIEYLTNDFLTQKLEADCEEIESIMKQDSKFPNIEYLRNRGSDDKGPAFGIADKKFSTKGERVDAMKNRDYDDIVTVNSEGERLFRSADRIKTEKSAAQWNKSEVSDQDIIEAGVDNLGDLIKTGWFDRNKQDGAVRQLYQDNEGNQI